MNIWFVRLKWIAAVVFGLTVAGCIGGQSEPARFYMLAPMSPASVSSASVSDPRQGTVSLEPVEVPEYLNRPQIVTHLEGSEYQLDEFNEWAEPLSDNLTRVMAENLSEILGADGIDIISMYRPVETEYSIAVQILRLDGEPGGKMVLIARWSLFHQMGDVLLLTERSVFQEAMSDGNYKSFVEGQSRLVASLSRKIADGIRPIILSQPGS